MPDRDGIPSHMPDRLVITGLGVVSSIGTTRDAFFESLATSRAAQRTTPSVSRGNGAAALAATGVAAIGDFGARRILDPRNLRRTPRLSQMALVAAYEAVAQAAATGVYAPERCGVVLGTGLGTVRETFDFIRGYIEGGPEVASPMLFPSSVMNAAAGQMAIELGLRGANSTINHREASALDALGMAADFLALDRADALIVGAVDELSDIALLGYSELARLSSTAMRPYALERDGTVLGEGAAMFYVERESAALGRGARVLAVLSGRGQCGEPRPRVGWGDRWEGAATAMRAALTEAEVDPSGVDYVAGSGTGLALDALEARALAEVFAEPVRVGSILGQTGDFMAGTALRVASAIYAIGAQALPGTVGHGGPDPAAPVPGLVRLPTAARVQTVLVPSLSQGGADSAVVLARP